MDRLKKKKKTYDKRNKRSRGKIYGTSDFPRLCVFRSKKNIYVQIIDDMNNKTITGVSSLSKDIKELLKDEKKTKSDTAELVGKIMANKCLEKNIKKIKFDRNGFAYTGRIKKLADSMRKSGVEF